MRSCVELILSLTPYSAGQCLLAVPETPGAATVTHLSERFLPAKTVIQIDSRSQRPMEHRCMHCIFRTNAKALYTLGHALDELLFVFAAIHQRHQMEMESIFYFK